ncbi:MAG: MBL fold metallo-hydrolase, partial [Gaiellaceae bacterium]
MATSLNWLGHSAFRVESPGNKHIYVDPFLTGNPKTPEAEREPERCDLILVTHGHGDHTGDVVAIHQRLGCQPGSVLGLLKVRCIPPKRKVPISWGSEVHWRLGGPVLSPETFAEYLPRQPQTRSKVARSGGQKTPAKSGRTLTTALQVRGSRAPFASHFPQSATLGGRAYSEKPGPPRGP